MKFLFLIYFWVKKNIKEVNKLQNIPEYPLKV